MRLAGGERGREGAGGGDERGRKERGQGKSGRGLQFPNHALRASEGQQGGAGVGDPGPTWPRGQWAQAHGDSRTPQLARPRRTRAEAKINVRRADRARPVGGPNIHPHLTTQRASVHAGPGARVGPTAGPPRPPDLRGSLGESGLLPAASLGAIVGPLQGAERPGEATERGPSGQTAADGQRDEPRTHSALGVIPVGPHREAGTPTQVDTGRPPHTRRHTDTPLVVTARHGRLRSMICLVTFHSGTLTQTTSGILTPVVTRPHLGVTSIHRDGAGGDPQRQQAASTDTPSETQGHLEREPRRHAQPSSGKWSSNGSPCR